MDYETPALEEIGSASELIQSHAGLSIDGGGNSFSQGLVCTPFEEE